MEKEDIEQEAKNLGFDLCKIIPAESLQNISANSLNQWLDEGMAGEMEYMKEDPERRWNPLKNFPDAKSIIVVGLNYYPGDHVSTKSTNVNTGRVARYSWGRDYHKVIEGKLKKLKKFIEGSICDQNDSLQTRLYVDYGPILERAYAERAGLGYIGRNTCLITEEFGSWIFLAELITNVDLSVTEQEDSRRGENDVEEAMDSGQVPKGNDRSLSCGTCTQCIQVCPTGALEAPYKLNANKCISYLTIENKGPIPEDLRPQIGDWLYGCDLCQDVCPHNVRAKATKEPDFKKRILGDMVELQSILTLRTDEEFRERFAGSPVIRIKRRGLLRNACVVAANLKATELLPVLKECLQDEEYLVREHAAWAIKEIGDSLL